MMDHTQGQQQMPNDTLVCSILNDLLSLEARSLLRRLAEAEPFVEAGEIEAGEAVRRMVAEQERDRQRLAQTLLDLGGEPRLVASDITSADLHYVELPRLLPRVIACQEDLVARYEQAVPAVAEHPLAAEVVCDVADHRRAHLDYLRKLAASLATS